MDRRLIIRAGVRALYRAPAGYLVQVRVQRVSGLSGDPGGQEVRFRVVLGRGIYWYGQVLHAAARWIVPVDAVRERDGTRLRLWGPLKVEGH